MKAKKLPSGNWNCQVYVGEENGKRKYVSVTAPTKREAEYKAAEIKLKRPSRNTMTLRQASEKYVEIKSKSLSASTVRLYKSIASTRMPQLMDKKICDIRQEDIQYALNVEAASHSPKTVRNYNGLVSTVLKMFRPDFAYSVSLPRKEKKSVYIPDKKTIDRIAEAIKGKRIELPFLLASRMGLRASEIAGLQYGDFDKQKKTVTISRAMVRGVDGQAIKEPKSDAGYRPLPCPDQILEMIGEGPADQFVVGMTQTDITNAWSYFMRHSGEKFFSFHKLRHYFASRALLTGVPQRYIMELMGHSTPDMLNKIYQHTFPDEKEEFAQRIINM